MSASILTTKLYLPPPRLKVVARARLIARLNEGLSADRHSGLTLISAPAGFGKTTLVSEWIANNTQIDLAVRVAWLSLDEGDNDPKRFLTYLIAALQTIIANFGVGVLGMLQSPQPSPPDSILTALLNDLAAVPDKFVLILDDYHLIDSKPVAGALAFMVEHLPPQMYLVIATREDPDLPLARLRARSQLTELRATDLRFTLAEAADFLNQVMGLKLSADNVAVLESRTEGWIAGLQLAAISLQGHQDTSGFIKSFTGSHRFVLDYLVEEVLQQQPADVQFFLLHTSILDRLCGPLCDAVLGQSESETDQPSAFTLDRLERANLFIVPLDNERRWYRYHHLFADLLRQRLQQHHPLTVNDLHIRASTWYENNGLEIESFQHAAVAHDVARAERLIEGKGMPLHFRGAVSPVLNWLETLSESVLNVYPSLWTSFASVLLASGQVTRVEPTLQAAEAVLQNAEPNDHTRDLIGRVAAIRATSAGSQNQFDVLIAQSHRALEYLHPNNFAFRTSTTWKLGFAHHFMGERASANQAYNEVIAIGQATGNTVFSVAATIGLGNLQEADNQLHLAEATYQRVLQLVRDQPLPFVSEVYFGLGRLSYKWNELDIAEQHLRHSLQLVKVIEKNDRHVSNQLYLARVKLAQGDMSGAAVVVAEAEQSVRQHNFVLRIKEVAAQQVLILIRQGNLGAAAQLAQTHALPLSQARVQLAQGDPAAALAVLEPLREQMEVKGWHDERLKIMCLQAVAHHAHGNKAEAVQLLTDALTLAEPGGFVRLFVDEGPPMAQVLSEVAARGLMSDYVAKLLAVFESESKSALRSAQPLVEPLSERELEVLQLIAQGLSNQEISERLFIALSSVKGHNQNIFGKLQVQRRTEAVARARELGLL